jgi:hypothetical protein
LPVVLTQGEVQALLAELKGLPHVAASLLYGAGLRVLECVRLRGPSMGTPMYSACFSLRRVSLTPSLSRCSRTTFSSSTE